MALSLGLVLPSAAQERETFLLRGEDQAGRALESRLSLTTRADGTLWIEHKVQGPEGNWRQAGVALRQTSPGETRLRLELPQRSGAAGSLRGGSAASATYRFHDQSVEAVLLAGGRVLSRQVGHKLSSPAPVASYSSPSSQAGAGPKQAELAAINADASALLLSLSEAERALRYPVIVVPGFASEDQGDTPLHPRTKKRAQRAVRLLRKKGAHAILCSGANVRPVGTPFNEALELRRYLVEELGVPSWRVAVEPRARHTTTNMRNVGRFLLAHGLTRALVVTSRGQSFYLSAPGLSTFHRRCRATLGYEVGKLRVRSHWTTLFKPSPRVFEIGDDPLDP